MRRILFLIALWCCAAPATQAAKFNVADEQGRPIKNFEWMYHTEYHGSGPWHECEGGTAAFDNGLISKSKVVDVIVRTDGYASAVARFQGESLEQLRHHEPTVTLEKGREVRVRFQLPPDAEFPKGFLPQLFFPDFYTYVRAAWKSRSRNLVPEDPDLDMLNVQLVEEGTYQFRLPSRHPEFHVSIIHPVWFDFCELGRYSADDFEDGLLELKIPLPGSLQASFDLNGFREQQLEFEKVSYHLMRQVHGRTHTTAKKAELPLGETFAADQLAPGSYLLHLRTLPRNATNPYNPLEIDTGRFMDQRRLEIKSGESREIVIQFMPLDEEAFRGDGTARIKVLAQDGSPAHGHALKVTYHDGHYGMLTVHEGQIPSDGITVLEGISRHEDYQVPFGPYTVEIDGERVGLFGFAPGKTTQEFEFRLIPKPGDMPPNIELIDVKSEKPLRLVDFKGRIVLLELWATWCGPCRPAMDKLAELHRSHANVWGDQVAIVPVSVDDDLDSVMPHVEKSGWSELTHYWSPPAGTTTLARAQQALSAFGVPTALLLDREGRIAWRGHPIANQGGDAMAQRIERLLAGKSLTSFWSSGVGKLCMVSLMVGAIAALYLPMRRRSVSRHRASS